MRNLFLFIARYHAFFIFIVLEAIAFTLIYQNNFYHRTFFVNSTNRVAGNLYLTVNNIQNYFQLKAINDSLLHENNRLRTHIQNLRNEVDAVASEQLPKNFYMDIPDAISDSLPDSLQRYQYIPSRVINNSIDHATNYLTIDKGQKDHIDVKMGVVSGQGVVGIVKDVSNHFSTVLSILHTDVRISGKLLESNYFGSVVWDGKDPTKVYLEDIPRQASVGVGDRVVTTGYSSIFPPNVLIGTVSDYEVISGSGFYRIQVQLATDMRKLRYVYVIKDLKKKEKKHLEASTADE